MAVQMTLFGNVAAKPETLSYAYSSWDLEMARAEVRARKLVVPDNEGLQALVVRVKRKDMRKDYSLWDMVITQAQVACRGMSWNV